LQINSEQDVKGFPGFPGRGLQYGLPLLSTSHVLAALQTKSPCVHGSAMHFGVPSSDSTQIGCSIGQVVAIQIELNPPGNAIHTGLSDVSSVQPTSMGQTLVSEQGFLIHSAIGGHGPPLHCSTLGKHWYPSSQDRSEQTSSTHCEFPSLLITQTGADDEHFVYKQGFSITSSRPRDGVFSL
jgi:hypothetical protein